MAYPCPYRDKRPTGRTVRCLEGCATALPVLGCVKFGECTYGYRGEGIEHCCRDCPERPREAAEVVPACPAPQITVDPEFLAEVRQRGVRPADLARLIPAPPQPPPDAAPVATAAPPPTFAPHSTDPPVGVVVGCFGWPRLAEVQVRLIRHTCGPVPILLASDDPESAPAFDQLASRYPDVFHWPNHVRIGHTGGDISAFFKGIIWGAARGLKVVAKLSQRFLVSRPRWLQDGAGELLASGLPLSTRTCRESSIHDLRTEACLLDVAQWNRPEVLARLMPRKYWHDLPAGLIAETIVYRVLQDLLNGIFWPWALLTENRLERVPGVVWHHADGLADYRRVAADMGVPLDADFHATRRDQELRDGVYEHG